MAYDTVGQQVIRVSSVWTGGSEETPGVIVKVARKYCTVEFDKGWPSVAEFDKSTGNPRGSGGFMPRYYIRTSEELEESRRKRVLTDALRGNGIDLNGRRMLTLEELEGIATVLGFGVE